MNEQQGPTDETRAQRILLVDDDGTIRHMLTYGLRAAGYEVEPTTNGREGLAAIETFQPDLIVLDLYMPELDGLTFLQQYQGPIPIIVCSGSDEEQDIQRTRDAGAAKFLQKPVSLAVLREAVDAILTA